MHVAQIVVQTHEDDVGPGEPTADEVTAVFLHLLVQTLQVERHGDLSRLLLLLLRVLVRLVMVSSDFCKKRKIRLIIPNFIMKFSCTCNIYTHWRGGRGSCQRWRRSRDSPSRSCQPGRTAWPGSGRWPLTGRSSCRRRREPAPGRTASLK